MKKLAIIVLVYICTSLGMAATKAARLVIDVSDAGKVMIEKAPVEIEKLKDALVEKRKNQPEIEILVVASEQSGSKVIEKVLDACRSAGIKSFALQSR